MILLIEDDAAIVDATTMLLESEGLEVIGTSDVQDALARVQSGLKPDLVITDNRMPAMTGIDFVEKLRALDINCPCLLMTGDPGAANIRNANIENCIVLGKPVAPDKLLKFVRDMLE